MVMTVMLHAPTGLHQNSNLLSSLLSLLLPPKIPATPQAANEPALLNILNLPRGPTHPVMTPK